MKVCRQNFLIRFLAISLSPFFYASNAFAEFDWVFSLSRDAAGLQKDESAAINSFSASDLLIPKRPLQEKTSGNEISPGGAVPDIWAGGENLLGGEAIRNNVDIDALSRSYPKWWSKVGFNLAFSVNAESRGLEFGGEQNVAQQYETDHHSGDVFYALPKLYLSKVNSYQADNKHIDRLGIGNTHSLSNEFLSDQTDFNLPIKIITDDALQGAVYDDINALDIYAKSLSKNKIDRPIYLSVTKDSINWLSNTGSGADILRSENGAWEMWAGFQDLGLWSQDEIDALIIFGDDDRHYEPKFDTVIFSLKAGSPMLSTIHADPADLLIAQPPGKPSILVHGFFLGLRSADDLNAMAPFWVSTPYKSEEEIE